MAEYIKIELSKELKDKTKTIIEKSAKGKIKAGLNEVTKAIERGNAKLVVVAEDVSPIELVMHIPILCNEKNVACSYIETRKELGEKAGLRMATSAIAIIESSAENEIKDLAAKIKELKK
ncbi:MAG: ribosomal L7Ae/L30e/S12e/Gadd45 family protein [Candidatus ainarchaeum sp.]|nr:ribosomal L7Ae/L30e/S12e/Gadd45 family protein [Candidatus ainarchaeum sp.]